MKQPRNPSTRLVSRFLSRSKGSNHKFPPSPQSDLWNYLKPEQQEAIKPILRDLKKPAQEELCCSLLDYMETGIVLPPEDLLLAATFMYLTHQGISDVCGNDAKPIIRPLRVLATSQRR